LEDRTINMEEQKEITIYDIARHLNISAATVSRGLNNNPMISKATRKKIADTAKSLGYQSNTFASSLRSKQTHTIGVLVPRLNSYFMSSVLAGMEKVANLGGYNLIIAQSLENVEREKTNALTMFNKRVDGLLISLSYDTQDLTHLELFFKKRIPVVFFDRVGSHTESTSVVIDNYSEAYNITRHLIDQGCKKIMHLGGNTHLNVYKDRLAGFKQALADHNLPFVEEFHLISNLSEDAGSNAAKFILDLAPGDRPDSVFSANDTAAVHCMIILKNANVAIPNDIAFAGFNNDPSSKIIEPNLTTVDYPGKTMGEAAATTLINHLKGITNIYITNLLTLKSGLIIRASSLKKPLSF